MRECPFIFGQYEAEESVAFGAAGVTYRARFGGRGGGQERNFSLYLLNTAAAADGVVVSRLQKGVARSQGLSHPNLIQVLDYGEVEGEPYVASEWVPGRSLSRLSNHLRSRGKRWPAASAAVIACEVAKALAFIHSARDALTGDLLQVTHGLVHPDAIFLTYGGLVKIAHLPVAWAEGQRVAATLTGACYVSPEGSLNWDVDNRGDLFSLGVVLWEMLTGTPLFATENAEQRKTMLFDQPIEPPSKREPEVPPELDKITLKLLERDLYLRYQTGDEVLKDLSTVLKFRFSSASLGELTTFCQKEFQELREQDQASSDKVRASPKSTALQSRTEGEKTRTLMIDPKKLDSAEESEKASEIRVETKTNIGTFGLQKENAAIPESESVRPQRRPVKRESVAPAIVSKSERQSRAWVALVVGALLLIAGGSFFAVKHGRTKTKKSSVRTEMSASGEFKVGKAVLISGKTGYTVEVDGKEVEISEDFEIPVPLDVPTLVRIRKPGFEEIVLDRTFFSGGESTVELDFKKLDKK